MNAALVVLLALAVSLGGNAVLYKALRGAHDLEVKAETKFEQQHAATEQCNASVAALKQQADERAAENTKLRQEAQNRRRAQESLAQQILATPATTPGNDCKSAGDRVRNWLKSRKP